MKNSAWYYKLWRKKLDELPVDGNVDLGWTNMQQMLDKQMPVDTAKKSIVKPIVAKIFTLLGYVLPAAAMIGTITYFNLPKPAKQNTIKGKAHHINYNYKNRANNNTSQTDSALIIDSAELTTNKVKSAPIIDSIGQNQHTNLNTSSFKEVTANSNHSALSTKLSASQLKISSQAFLNNSNYGSVANTGNYKKPYKGLARSTKNNESSYYSLNSKVSNVGKSAASKVTNTNKGNLIDLNSKELTTNSTRTGNNKDTAANAGANNKEQASALIDAPLNAANNKDNSNKANKVPPAAKEKKARNKTNGLRQDIVTPLYNYGLEAGLNTGNHSKNLFAGIFVNYTISKRMLIGAQLRVNASKPVSGVYSYPITYRKDSIVSYTINDRRKVVIADIPLNLEYKVTNNLSLKAGPVISFLVSKSGQSNSITPTGNLRDSTYSSKGIDSLIKTTTLNKINFGFSGGVSFYLNHVGLEARYQHLTPFKVSNSLGSYNQTNKSFQISLSYRFK